MKLKKKWWNTVQMKFKSVVWSSTIDYPNEVSTVLFVGTCNWDCEYCYNKSLNKNRNIDFKKQILPRLLDRKDFINHVIISGGECTLYSDLEETIDILNENGFIVGIHTNGSKPEVITRILPKIKFVGMDIKGDIDIYKTIAPTIDILKVISSIEIISRSNIQSEFRTTLYPKFCTLETCTNMVSMLRFLGVKEWILQEYTNDFNKGLISPYSKECISQIIKVCNKILPTRLKGEQIC
jgi:pyruvate formate lyase activating enzyme